MHGIYHINNKKAKSSTVERMNCISPIIQSGFLSSVPYICQVVVTLIGGALTDYILKKRLVKVVWMRKINTALGLGIPALFVVLAGYIRCDAILAVVFFSISTGFTGFTGKNIPLYFLILSKIDTICILVDADISVCSLPSSKPCWAVILKLVKQSSVLKVTSTTFI